MTTCACRQHRITDVYKRQRQLIGRSYIPPKWAFGLAQSRFGYKTAEDVREVARQYKENDLPLDMIHASNVPRFPPQQ